LKLLEKSRVAESIDAVICNLCVLVFCSGTSNLPGISAIKEACLGRMWYDFYAGSKMLE
jgi:hypothetical protein